MPTYLVTYRFGHGGDYGARVDQFLGRIQEGDWWGETGSTVLVNSDETIDAFCRRILAPSCFNDRLDIAVVFDVDNRQARAKGSLRDGHLFVAAPWVKRI